MPHTKVFLPWSGERSNAIAKALREWLPLVIQDLHPWMSESDVEKGTRWNSEIALQLQAAKVDIICLTPENLDAPWINFEAGALSKLADSYVCTYLFELSPGQVKDPLAQFQATKSEKEDTRKLLQTTNKKILGDEGLSDKQLETSFDKWSPDLETSLRRVSSMPKQDKRPKRSADDMLEEVLQISRDRIESEAIPLKGIGTVAAAVEKLLDAKPAHAPRTLAELLGTFPSSALPAQGPVLEKLVKEFNESMRKKERKEAGKDASPNLRSERLS